MRDAAQVRRRAMLLLGVLAATLLLAGLLPWLTGGETTIRLFGLPLVLAGLLVTGAALRAATVRRPAPSAPPVERTCTCGASGCALTTETAAGSVPTGEPAAADRPASTGSSARVSGQPSAEG